MRLHVEITTASRTSGVAVACRANSLASCSVKARRSRSATGAVLCEMPSASSSLMRASTPPRRSPSSLPGRWPALSSSPSSRSIRLRRIAMIAT